MGPLTEEFAVYTAALLDAICDEEAFNFGTYEVDFALVPHEYRVLFAALGVALDRGYPSGLATLGAFGLGAIHKAQQVGADKFFGESILTALDSEFVHVKYQFIAACAQCVVVDFCGFDRAAAVKSARKAMDEFGTDTSESDRWAAQWARTVEGEVRDRALTTPE